MAKSAPSKFAGGAIRSTPLLDDQPSTVDLLHFDQFVEALNAVIANQQTKTPFIIGIFGRWGTGKSTLMQMLQRRAEAQGLTTVWFSAWLYNQEKEIWAALLQSLSSTLSRKLSFGQKIRFALGVYDKGLEWSRLIYVLPRIVTITLMAGLPLLGAYLLSLLFPTEIGRALTQLGGLAGSVFVLFNTVVRPTIQTIRQRVDADFSLYRSIDYQSHIGFLDRFREQFARIVSAVPSTSGRVVVFIDDLDRCGPDKALEVLDTIKVFLDVPGCVFVLGVDVAVIHRALAKKYVDDVVAQDEYLSKIVQLPFHLPPLTEGDLRSYLTGLAVEFPDERCGEVLLACASRNPREMKRVVNTYAVHWYLAQARPEVDDVAPVRLAKIIVIQQSFSRLFSLLRDQPLLLGVLERSFRVTNQPGVESSPDPALSGVTVATSAAGTSLPPSLLPFADDTTIRHLLTMHELAQGDDANFAALAEEELVVYFNLTHRLGRAAPTSPSEAPAAQAQSTSEPNLDLGSRYLVLEHLASGGSSEVYLAEDRQTRRRVAVKRLVSSLSDDPTWMARFDREVRVLRSLGAHPHIAAVLDVGNGRDEDGRPFAFYVMEHVPGETLQAILAKRSRLPPKHVASTLLPIYDALGHIHAAGIVHRDLKPSALVVTPSGVPKLIDFGLAVDSPEGHDQLTQTGVVLGTPAYMSPEQAMGNPLGPSSDLFSLGVVTYECATGTNPMRADNAIGTLMAVTKGATQPPSALASDLTVEFDAFIAKILAKDPKDRYGTAAEAKLALQAALSGVAA